MRRELILDYLRAGLDALRRDGLAADVVVGPNEYEETADATLFFEVYATELDASRETERGGVARVVGTIVANAPVGGGSARLDAVAERIAAFFCPGAPGGSGFTSTDRRGRRTLVYATNVRRASPEIVDGRYKTSTHVDFELYEEE